MLQSSIGRIRADGAPCERASSVSWRRATGPVALCMAALSLTACGGDDATTTTPGEVEGPGEPGEPQGPTMTGPVYALSSSVFTTGGDRTVYFATTSSLDVPVPSLDDAREYGGVANYAAVSGRLLISSGEEPTITAFDVDDDMTWHERETLSFASYPLNDNANFFSQYLVDDHHMYLPFDGYKRIVWDPTDFAILGVMEDSTLQFDRDGMTLEPAGNRSGIRYAGGQVMMPFFYHDEDWFEFGAVSPIAVYDPVAHTEQKVVEAPCSGLAVASQDEAGYTYFSPYDYMPLLALYGQGPSPCLARLTPEQELDAGFTTDLRNLTGGRYTNSFRYIRDGWGLANVLNEELLGVDFSAPMTAEVQDAVWDEANWTVWKIDLVNGTARPFDEISIPSFGWNIVQVDGRSFLALPSEGITTMYEMDQDGNVGQSMTVTGDASWIRVR